MYHCFPAKLKIVRGKLSIQSNHAFLPFLATGETIRSQFAAFSFKRDLIEQFESRLQFGLTRIEVSAYARASNTVCSYVPKVCRIEALIFIPIKNASKNSLIS